ncbi:DoxX family protein [Salibacterium lacus]|uniref:DoxX family protein n=1 Tax=Salibacterium lacus TaxID=1898109 RepID=A0ABW5T5A1_9BACI
MSQIRPLLDVPRFLTAFVFIVSGCMKLLNPGMLSGMELPFPTAVMTAAAWVEIGCGVLLVLNKHVKNACILLLVIILGAIILTKVPLIESGFLLFLFEARLDIVMLSLLVLLFYKHPG